MSKRKRDIHIDDSNNSATTTTTSSTMVYGTPRKVQVGTDSYGGRKFSSQARAVKKKKE
jgi:hypothetical protein